MYCMDAKTKTDPRKVKPPWEPDIYQCRKCRKLMFSSRPGEFNSCKCGNFVDQTREYTRTGGNDLKIVQEGPFGKRERQKETEW